MHAFKKIQFTLALLIFIALTGNASAIVVSGTFPLPPEPWNDFAYGNVGQRGSTSGVYLGNGWVLTAKHVAPGDITFGDTTYHYDGQNSIAIKNPSGYPDLTSTYADLRLFHLTEEPDLPEIQIATESPPRGAPLYYVGYGSGGADDISYWTPVDEDQWIESEEPTYFWGYKLAARNGMTWGSNLTVSDGSGPTINTNIVDVNGTTSIALKTTFDSQNYDSQAVGGDSGGAAFYQNENGNWVLAGIICCIETYLNAPTPAFVDSGTYSVALSFYRDEILSIMAPIPGDANGDWVVDGSDVTILANNWQQPTDLGFEAGDFNEDGFVDGSDVTILANNWQYGVSDQAGTAAAGEGDLTVTEPSFCALLLGMLLSGCWAFCRSHPKK